MNIRRNTMIGIAVSREGFTVSERGEIFASVPWTKVKQVFAYTRFRGADIELCLAFSLPRSQDQVVVHETVDGWDVLKQSLSTHLGEVTNEWEERASCNELARRQIEPVSKVVPMYVANPVQVWPAGESDA